MTYNAFAYINIIILNNNAYKASFKDIVYVSMICYIYYTISLYLTVHILHFLFSQSSLWNI